jgi:hypothetical protein
VAPTDQLGHGSVRVDDRVGAGEVELAAASGFLGVPDAADYRSPELTR